MNETFDPQRTALIIQDMQNDVVTDGGVFADSGPAAHAKRQGAVEKLVSLANRLRATGGHVLHVWYVVEEGAVGQSPNAPLFESLIASEGSVRGSWGAAPAAGLEPQPGDLVIEKMRMNPFCGSRLEPMLRGLGIDTVISAGALTNMSVEHTARHAADVGFRVIVPSDGTVTFDEEWQHASLGFAVTNVAAVLTCDEIIEAVAS